MSKNIVILGAGFGGLRCALNLARRMSKEWRIILIDRNLYHTYYPRLYELIMPGERKDVCTVDVRDIIRGTKIEFVQGEAREVDCRQHTIKADGKTVNYDYLVLALGADTDYFGITGLQEYGCTLKNVGDAEIIKKKVGEFLKSNTEVLPAAQHKDSVFSVMIGGAGATGVEVAAGLAYLFRNISRKRWSITVVEALPHILSMFPSAMSQYAHEKLENLGVKLMLDTCIKEVRGINTESLPAAQHKDSVLGSVEVVLAPRPLKPGEKEEELVCEFLPEHEKRMRADLMLWAGGVRANPLLSKCGMPTDRKGRVEVDEHLRVKNMDNMFAIGDSALLLDPNTKQPVPAIAQAALLEGKIAAENIVASITGKALKLYSFPKFPAIVPLGNKDAVAIVGTRVVRGFLAWLLRQAADLRYYGSILPWWKAVKMLI